VSRFGTQEIGLVTLGRRLIDTPDEAMAGPAWRTGHLMKLIHGAMAAGLLLAGTGCVTMLDERSLARQQADFDSLRTDMDGLKERLNIIQAEQQALARDVEALRRMPREDAAVRTRVDQLEQQLRAVNAARESDRRQIVDELSKKVAGLINSGSATRGSSSGTRTSSGRSGASAETGYEHVVKSGETLSAIAQAYKVSIGTIMKANAIKSSDKLLVGQKLFIPSP